MYTYTKVDADFYIQLKGKNAGKPLKEAIPNSVGIQSARHVFSPDFLYYVFLSLHVTGCFEPYIKGSVVPYIRQSDITEVFIKQYLLKRAVVIVEEKPSESKAS